MPGKASVTTERIEIYMTRQVHEAYPADVVEFRALINGTEEKLDRLHATILGALTDAGASVEQEQEVADHAELRRPLD